jgi:hypothetical protein
MSVFAIIMWALSPVIIIALTEFLGRWLFIRPASRQASQVARLYEEQWENALQERARLSGRYPFTDPRLEREALEHPLKRLSRVEGAVYAHQRIKRLEFRMVIWLALVSAVLYLVAYLVSKPVFTDVQHAKFAPSDTAQVIAAVGSLGLAIGTSVAAVIRAWSLLLRARADVIRARHGIPPASEEMKRSNVEL